VKTAGKRSLMMARDAISRECYYRQTWMSDEMAKRREFECRFSVGKPDANHSMVWKVWASRRGSDVYVTATSMGTALKASIHGMDERHIGFTSNYVEDAYARKDWATGSRHWDQWHEGYPLEGGATLEFLIRLPTAELRSFPLRASDLKKGIIWLSPAPPSEAVEIALLYFAPGSQPVFSGQHDNTRLVCTGRLANLRQVWVVSRNIPFTPPTGEAFQEIAAQMHAAGMVPSALHDGTRLVLTFNDRGARGWVELATSSVQSESAG
jgi:hypothetical protein